MPKASPGSFLRLIQKYCRPVSKAATDECLLQRFVLQRDEGAFEALLRRHGGLVWTICRDVLRDRGEAEDAFQATFLVLARKAGTISKRESLASWLYKVALRIALKGRQRNGKRNAMERAGLDRLPERPAEAETTDVDPEWRPLLHEEIGRLPHKYQAPVVLCCLEGKTHDEAARQLGWPRGTVAGRLSRARALLQRRLRNRGLAVGGILLMSFGNVALAAVPSGLVRATSQTAFLFTAGQSAAALSKSTLLAEGVIRAMFISKVKLIACSVLVVAAVGTAAFTHGVSGSQEPGKPDQVQAPADKPAPPAAKIQREPEVVRLASPRDGVIVAVGSITKRLRVGDRVQAGQTVVRLDDRLALNELRIAQAKMKAAEAELEGHILTYKEAQARFETAEKLWRRTPPLIAEEDYRERKIAADKYQKQIASKREAVNLAEFDIRKAEIILDMHKISSPVDGVVSKVHRGPGEGVRALEPVIEIRADK